MHEYFASSAYFGLFLSIFAFEVGVFLKNKTGKSWANPLLISIFVVIPLSKLFQLDTATFNASGAANLSWLLSLCTISLAVPLYRQLETLKHNALAILGGIASGVAACMISIPVLGLLLHISHEQYVSMLSKSITTAIGIDMTTEFNGFVSITIVAIYFTGIVGNMMADTFCKWFKVTEPIAVGIAIGTSSHAMGTARALELGEVQGAMSGLSIATTGLLTALVIPFVANLL